MLHKYVPSVATALPPFGILSKSQSILEATPLALSSMSAKFNTEIYKVKPKPLNQQILLWEEVLLHYNMATKAHA